MGQESRPLVRALNVPFHHQVQWFQLVITLFKVTAHLERGYIRIF